MYTLIPASQYGLWVAFVIVLLACVSEATGQSIVLFLNRVRPQRFGLALTIGVVSNLIGYGIWTLTIWTLGRVLFGNNPGLRTVAGVVGLAYAPQVFSFLILVPVLGNTIGVVLSLWSMAAIIVAIDAGFGLAAWEAATLAVVGWLLLQGAHRSLGRPLQRLQRSLASRAAGVKLVARTGDTRRLRRHPLPTWAMQLDGWRHSRLAEAEPTAPAGDPTHG